MYKLKDRFLSEHIHSLVYGESLEQHIQKEVAEETRRKIEEVNKKAIAIMLVQTSLSIAQIASMIDVSEEIVLKLQKKIKSKS